MSLFVLLTSINQYKSACFMILLLCWNQPYNLDPILVEKVVLLIILVQNTKKIFFNMAYYGTWRPSWILCIFQWWILLAFYYQIRGCL